ncbi:RNA ligase/cyclic nucleotide phosphodiesterase [Venturia nashicola]|uniref:RNA ligase/cyclic nucleotide phosphodiesterase n=1 Tax=Venturia nashicola TaxID=86259 RepID=A0A4Z1P3N0_9PEZI|nr:RNA ligase/cyclic nucleotide phosphodiesterase [Venturia nashicola]
MPTPAPLASNPFQDLSGVDTSAFSNPYDALIQASNNDAKELQKRYDTHRTTRNAQQKEKLLSPHFAGVIIDPILLRLEDSDLEPGFVDPRHCLVFWARPTEAIKSLISQIQLKLLDIVPHLWLMPSHSQHMTVLEITHSKTAPEIASLKESLSSIIPDITNISSLNPAKRARLVKPFIGYDASALALSFLPVASEKEEDRYSYHHLRRDIFALASQKVKIESRYIVPSAHITIGRFIDPSDFAPEDPSQIEKLVKVIDDMNTWLTDEFWPKEDGTIKEGGEWRIGEEKGLDCRFGTLWYGGGESIMVGNGFLKP